MRYLATLHGSICHRAGTLDELHQQILASRRRNGFRTTYDIVDVWNDPGRVVDKWSAEGNYVIDTYWEEA